MECYATIDDSTKNQEFFLKHPIMDNCVWSRLIYSSHSWCM